MTTQVTDLFAAVPAPLTLKTPPFQRVAIQLVGCGGTGSHLLSGLAALMLDLEGRGIGCELTLTDMDSVEKKNVGRQLFASGEIGLNKAQALARRMLAAYGRVVVAQTEPVALDTLIQPERGALSIVIGAVDNPAARAVISEAVAAQRGGLWWLDCGNETFSGQVAIGNETRRGDIKAQMTLVDGLPAPHLVYPDLVETPKPGRAGQTQQESCAEGMESGRQGLMINRMVAAWALGMLEALVRGDLRYHAVDFDLKHGGARSRAIDMAMVEAFGKKK